MSYCLGGAWVHLRGVQPIRASIWTSSDLFLCNFLCASLFRTYIYIMFPFFPRHLAVMVCFSVCFFFFSRSLLIFNPGSLLANRCSRPQDNFTLIRTVNHAHLVPLPAGMITPAPTKESPSNGCCIISRELYLNLSLTIWLVTCSNQLWNNNKNINYVTEKVISLCVYDRSLHILAWSIMDLVTTGESILCCMFRLSFILWVLLYVG